MNTNYISLLKSYGIWMVLIVALILRFIVIHQSLWLDEAIGALVVKKQNYIDILLKFPKGDNHPPLYYLTLKLWSDIFGYSEIALRSLSAFFGVLTIYFIYKIAFIIWNSKKIALTAAILLATSQFHIYYSQEARMYVMTGFFACTSIYYFLRTLKQKSIINWVLFYISLASLIFTDYVPVLLLPVFWLFALSKIKKRSWILKFSIAHIPLVLLGILWLPIFQFQQRAGAEFLQKLPAWKEIAGGATLRHLGLLWSKFTLGRISLVNKELYFFLMIFFSAFVMIALLQATKKYKRDKLIWIWLIIPPFIGFIASFVFPLFIYFRFTFILPAFYLLIARGIWLSKDEIGKILLIVILMGNILSMIIYYSDHQQQREQWKQAVSYIEQEANEDSIVVFANPEPFAPYQWYSSDKVETLGALSSVQIDPVKARDRVTSKLIDKHGVFYFEYLEDIMDTNEVVRSTIEYSDFEVVDTNSFIGIGNIYKYKREN